MPVWALYIIGFFMPLTVVLLTHLVDSLLRRLANAPRRFHPGHDLNASMLGYFLALGISELYTVIGKFYAGRPRPDYWSRPAGSASMLIDGRESFPSGHSSMSFVAATFSALYLLGKLAACAPGRNGGRPLNVLLGVAPITVGWLVAISRTRDYHHGFADILGGSLVGFISALVGYFSQYRPLTDAFSGVARIRDDVE